MDICLCLGIEKIEVSRLFSAYNDVCSLFSCVDIWSLCLSVVNNAGGKLFSAYNDVCIKQKSVLNALVLK